MIDTKITPQILREISAQLDKDSDALQKINAHLGEISEWICSRHYGEAEKAFSDEISSTEKMRERLLEDIQLFSSFLTHFADDLENIDDSVASAFKLE